MDVKLSQKRLISNIIGVVATIIFAATLTTIILVKKSQEKQAQRDTELVLGRVEDAFLMNNSAGIRAWARGEYRDAWGGFIHMSVDDTFRTLTSAGADKEFGTEDDIVFDSFVQSLSEEIASVASSVMAYKAGLERRKAEEDKPWTTRWKEWASKRKDAN